MHRIKAIYSAKGRNESAVIGGGKREIQASSSVHLVLAYFIFRFVRRPLGAFADKAALKLGQ